MQRLSWSAIILASVLTAHTALAAVLPLTFHATDLSTPPLLRIETYEMQKGPNQELRIHLNAKDAKALQQLTLDNLGRTLILKQGENILASPTLRAPITGQDFVVSFKKE